MLHQQEKERLDNIAKKSIYAMGISKITQLYCSEIFLRYMVPGIVLELGPAEGLMTDILYPKYQIGYTVVDGSEMFINQIKNRYPEINAVVSTFEEFLYTPPPPVIAMIISYWDMYSSTLLILSVY